MFWRIFAVVALGFVIGGWWITRFSEERSHVTTVQKRAERGAQWAIRRMLDNQYEEATIGLSNGKALSGFLSGADEDFVYLDTVYSESGKERRSVVPWEGISYITSHTHRK